jgi:hypothetical protein
MQQSLSVHSQPSSIPINDQSLISPMHQNESHPATPMESNSDQKPDIQSLRNTLDEQIKNQENSQLNANGGGGSMNVNCNDAPKSSSSISSSSNATNVQTKHIDSIVKDGQSFKRPVLAIRECENNAEEDFTTNQSLYDYSTWEAW